jgi:hypothetical protein
MNIPLSAIEPFGISIPTLGDKKSETDMVWEIANCAREMINSISGPITPADIHMVEVILLKFKAHSILIYWDAKQRDGNGSYAIQIIIKHWLGYHQIPL